MMHYVLGFAIHNGEVVLIRKAKPEWQAGKLNGVGGKVEPGETGYKAMRREYREETGVDVPESRWRHYATLLGEGYSVLCYVTNDKAAVRDAQTVEKEEVVRRYVETLTKADLIHNVRYLIDIATDTELASLSTFRYGFVGCDLTSSSACSIQ